MVVKVLALGCLLLLIITLVRRDVNRNDIYNQTKEKEGSSDENAEENHY